MKKSKYKTRNITSIGLAFSSYILFSFVKADFNPFNYTEGLRLLEGIIFIFVWASWATSSIELIAGTYATTNLQSIQ